MPTREVLFHALKRGQLQCIASNEVDGAMDWSERSICDAEVAVQICPIRVVCVQDAAETVVNGWAQIECTRKQSMPCM